jgi:hypothetical protein
MNIHPASAGSSYKYRTMLLHARQCTRHGRIQRLLQNRTKLETRISTLAACWKRHCSIRLVSSYHENLIGSLQEARLTFA